MNVFFLGMPLRKNFGSGRSLQSLFHCVPLRIFAATLHVVFRDFNANIVNETLYELLIWIQLIFVNLNLFKILLDAETSSARQILLFSFSLGKVQIRKSDNENRFYIAFTPNFVTSYFLLFFIEKRNSFQAVPFIPFRRNSVLVLTIVK